MNIHIMQIIRWLEWVLVACQHLNAERVPVVSMARRRWMRGQSATEYIVLLGSISAMVMFSSPFLGDMRETVNETFTCAARRILSDGRWRTNSSLPHPCR